MPKVAVALSGGIDSSVVAYLLKKQGFEVEGFFLRLKFDHPALAVWRESEGRAALIASSLGIPFHVVDVRDEFEKEIWEPFWNAYKKGLTPNPCPFCNPKIKFGLLFKKAKFLGCENLATGHYARITKKKGIWKLKRGLDETKDQSYFLYRVPQSIFPNIIFPLGSFRKSEVREIAKEVFSENFSQTPESQELCFIPEEFSGFSRKILPQKQGEIVDCEGRIISRHDGAWFFTEGQKVGIGNIGGHKPLYVVAKNTKKNQIKVTEDINDPAFLHKEFELKRVIWINKPESNNFRTKVQIRYRSKPISCTIEICKNIIRVTLAEPNRSITPGQSAVFYRGDEVLGGGEIDKIL